MAEFVCGSVVVAMVAGAVVIGSDVVSPPVVVVSVVVGGHSEELLGTVPGTVQSNFAAVMQNVIKSCLIDKLVLRLTDIDVCWSLDFEEKTATLW